METMKCIYILTKKEECRWRTERGPKGPFSVCGKGDGVYGK